MKFIMLICTIGIITAVFFLDRTIVHRLDLIIEKLTDLNKK